MRKNIAAVGAGYWGKNIIRNLYELGSLKTICDEREELKEIYEKNYPDTTFTSSFSSVLLDPFIKAVAIATPEETHYELARKALLADKDVFVEKSLTLKLEEGEKLAELVEKKGKILMVGHILRYHPAVNKLKELIDKKELGEIQYIYSNRLNMGRIRSKADVLWDFAPHDISVILFLLDEFPDVIFSTGGSYFQPEALDVALTHLDFPSGVKAHIFVSRFHPFKEQKLVVIGSRKMAVFDDVSKEKLFLYSHKIKWMEKIPVVQRADPELISFEMKEPLKLELEHFIDCIEKHIIPKTDVKEGLRVLRVLQASQKSLETGKKIYL